MAKHVKIAGRSFSIPESSDLGEDNTTSNEGTGVGLAMPKSGVNLPFKSLKAGANVTITYDTNSVTIASTGDGGGGGTGDITGAENIGSSGYSIFAGEVDGVLQFKKLSLGSYGLNLQTMVGGELMLSTLYPDMGVNLGDSGAEIYSRMDVFGPRMGMCFRRLRAGTNVTLSQWDDYITINAESGGEANTASNQGTGTGLVMPKYGVDLPFKTLKAGTNVSITSDSDSVTISSTDTGEVNTASNLGTTGEGVFAQKSGADLQFKKLKAGSNVSITSDSESVTISSTDTGEVNTASNLGEGAGVYKEKVGTDLRLRSILPGNNVVVSYTDEAIIISAIVNGSLETATLATLPDIGTVENLKAYLIDDVPHGVPVGTIAIARDGEWEFSIRAGYYAD